MVLGDNIVSQRDNFIVLILNKIRLKKMNSLIHKKFAITRFYVFVRRSVRSCCKTILCGIWITQNM